MLPYNTTFAFESNNHKPVCKGLEMPNGDAYLYYFAGITLFVSKEEHPTTVINFFSLAAHRQINFTDEMLLLVGYMGFRKATHVIVLDVKGSSLYDVVSEKHIRKLGFPIRSNHGTSRYKNIFEPAQLTLELFLSSLCL